ncbi:MAG TPA: UDP-N-acetylmuramoyl-tripeptide--D-alanyl-D-alanine ligase [Gammaproteobacteria bacterium]|nr:UDP-N-acetylmuramoyl-tripeptide--D-alanyl-D-alanine ligase [Gammaproteobacteria bacterium]
MIAMQLSESARLLDAELAGPDAPFAGVSTDTRTLQQGNLFVALQGPSFDGHAFLDQARSRGAAGAAVQHGVADPLAQLVVPDTRRCLGDLARHWRGRFSLPVIAVTGSNGKTTVKEMIAAVLRRRGEVLATRGNLNNDIGVPLTLFGLNAEHASAVVEMGANHCGEIANLASIAGPTVAVVTNAGPAHLEGFGSLDGVARGKGELFSGLGDDGIAVINADDPYAPLWRELAGERRVMDFALEKPAAVSATWQAEGAGSRLDLRTPDGELEIQLALPGRHNVMNALAAAAAALAAGASLTQVGEGLGSLQPVPGRLTVSRRKDGVEIIDDTYNANPASLAAALEVLGARGGRRWVVLGDMGELGAGAQALHARTGRELRAAGVDRLYALGPLAAAAADAFGEGARPFPTMEALVAALTNDVQPGVSVLVKGSRRMQMERAVHALVGPAAPAGARTHERGH